MDFFPGLGNYGLSLLLYSLFTHGGLLVWSILCVGSQKESKKKKC